MEGDNLNLKEGYFEGANELSIFYLRDIPQTAKAIIIISHGFMEHSGRYIEFAQQLVANGYGVCLMDHRGNGRSAGIKGDIDDFFDYVKDMKYLVTQLTKYKTPIFTYGHSMGGLITFLYGLKYPTDLCGQIYSSPALAPPRVYNYFPAGFSQLLGENFPTFRIKRGGVNVAVKGRDYKRMFREDKLVNKYATARFFDQFLRKGMLYAKNNAPNYETACLFLMAEKDYVIPLQASNAVIANIPSFNKTIKVYPNCMHDLLHDDSKNVEQVIAAVLDWIQKEVKDVIK
ncbi:MAG: hypothetical protein BEN18_02345 [Epulopiscium sp. Nuni2H_MBin001]|nr:MAG: hypothetical protein BEN18_02345 [Epulopiscium sp. Nuni2H_MBin001]